MNSGERAKTQDLEQKLEAQQDRIGKLEAMVRRLSKGMPDLSKTSNGNGNGHRGGISRAGLIKGVAAGTAGLVAAEVAGVFSPSSAMADNGISNAALFRATGLDGSGNNPSGVGFSTYPQWDSSTSAYTEYQQGVWAYGSYSGVQGMTGSADFVFRENTAIAGDPSSGISPCGVYGLYGIDANTYAPGGNGVQGDTDSDGFSGVYGRDNSGKGGYGVQASSVNGIGVYSSVANNDAIQGHSSKAGKSGVAGFGDNSTGFGTFGQGLYGVWGRTVSTTDGRVGVVGTTDQGGGGGPTSGVYGIYGNGANNGVGVKGESTANDGLQGHTSAAGFSGLYAHDSSAAPGGYGVSSYSDNGVGVFATSSGNDGLQGHTSANGASGLYAHDASPSGGKGVFGVSDFGVGIRATSGGNDAMQGNTTANGRSGLYATDNSSNGGWGVYASSNKGVGVYAHSGSTAANATSLVSELSPTAPGSGSAAVYGKNDGTNGNGYGVQGSHAGSGLGGYFTSATGKGVEGSVGGAGTGVYGVNTDTFTKAIGVLGELTSQTPGANAAAVSGRNDGTNGNGYGVQGTHAGSGYGGYFTSASGRGLYGSTGDTRSGALAVLGELNSTAPGSGSAAVYGKNDGTNGNGFGVQGSHAGSGQGGHFTSKSGVAVGGVSINGRGGSFSGPVAQISLSPGTGSGAPGSGAHLAGDLYLDKSCNLYLCTASGSPGSWKQVVVQ